MSVLSLLRSPPSLEGIIQEIWTTDQTRGLKPYLVVDKDTRPYLALRERAIGRYYTYHALDLSDILLSTNQFCRSLDRQIEAAVDLHHTLPRD